MYLLEGTLTVFQRFGILVILYVADGNIGKNNSSENFVLCVVDGLFVVEDSLLIVLLFE